MFSTTLIQSLVDLFTDNVDLVNCYILNNSHETSLEILKISKNILYFKSALITNEDIDNNKTYFEFSNNKKMYLLTVFLNTDISSKLLELYPNLTIFTLYHSEFLNETNKKNILSEETSTEYSYNSGFMGSDYMCKLFRKLIFNFFDDI